jgi:hypothetical protein
VRGRSEQAVRRRTRRRAGGAQLVLQPALAAARVEPLDGRAVRKVHHLPEQAPQRLCPVLGRCGIVGGIIHPVFLNCRLIVVVVIINILIISLVSWCVRTAELPQQLM